MFLYKVSVKPSLFSRFYNKMYVVIGAIVICVMMATHVSVKKVSALTSSELHTYIYDTPHITYLGSSPEIVEKIRRQVATMLATNSHDLMGARLWGTSNQLLWGHGKAVATLSSTLPYLETQQADQLKSYLRQEVTTNLLSSSYVQTEISGSIGKSSSIGHYGVSWSSNHAFCYDGLYGIWAYAQYAQDTTLVKNNWSTIKSIYSLCQGSTKRYLGTAGNSALQTYTSAANNMIAGTVAMVRMAVMVGDSATESSANTQAVQLFNDKIQSTTNASNNPVKLMSNGGLGRYLYIDQYQDMSIDLARFLKDKQQAKVSAQFATIVDRFRTWYLSDYDHVSDWMSVAPFAPVTDVSSDRPGEEGFQTSLFAHPIFMARAYVIETPVATIRKELPFAQSSKTTPASFDMFRLDYLVAIMNRQSTIIWQ